MSLNTPHNVTLTEEQISVILSALDKTVKYADSEYINIIDPIYEELEGVIDNYYDKIEKAKSKQPTPDW